MTTNTTTTNDAATSAFRAAEVKLELSGLPPVEPETDSLTLFALLELEAEPEAEPEADEEVVVNLYETVCGN